MNNDDLSPILMSPNFRAQLQRRMRPGHDAREVLGKTWERTRGKTPQVTNPTAWLLHNAENNAKDDAKAKRRRNHHERNETDSSAYPHNAESARGVQEEFEPIDDRRPDRRLEQRERRRKMRNAVRSAALLKKHRCALWAWLRGNIERCARQFQVRPGTVRVWKHRAIAKLKPVFEHAGLRDEL